MVANTALARVNLRERYALRLKKGVKMKPCHHREGLRVEDLVFEVH